MRNGAAKVGTPLPKVVVDVNRGNAGGAGAAPERCQTHSHRFSLFDEVFRPWKVEVVDDMDEETHQCQGTGTATVPALRPARWRTDAVATRRAVIASSHSMSRTSQPTTDSDVTSADLAGVRARMARVWQ